MEAELEVGCWKTSSEPTGESISLEGEDEAMTTQIAAEFGEGVRPNYSHKSVTPMVSGLPLT